MAAMTAATVMTLVENDEIDLDAVAAAEPVDSDGAPVDEAVEVEAELEPQTETASEETPAMLRAEDV